MDKTAPRRCQPTDKWSVKLNERVCIGCLLPDCNEQSSMCLRSFLTKSRNSVKMVDRALEAINLRLNARDCDPISAKVLVETSERIRDKAKRVARA